MRVGAVRLLVVLSVSVLGCYGPSPSDPPPLGFGVSSQTLLRDVLVGYGFTPVDAECVAQQAFSMNPSTSNYADGSYDITQRILRSAGEVCGIEWGDYDFTSD